VVELRLLVQFQCLKAGKWTGFVFNTVYSTIARRNPLYIFAKRYFVHRSTRRAVVIFLSEMSSDFMDSSCECTQLTTPYLAPQLITLPSLQNCKIIFTEYVQALLNYTVIIKCSYDNSRKANFKCLTGSRKGFTFR
jgi:hypothetical protein